MPITLQIFLYLIVFIYGIVIGSFLNVCILRIPAGETIVSERSHCTKCSHVLHWYDLFPLFSWLALKGRCRYCGAPISKQYPIVEALNGIMWVLTFIICGWSVDSILICLVISALIVLSVIDWRTYEIPFGINVCIFLLGVVRLVYKCIKAGTRATLPEYIIGFFAVSLFLFLIFLITKGKGIGGGDIKLMAASGLFLGWKLSLLSLIFGCFFGSVIHIARMKLSGEGRVLAMGPYLSAGILVAMWFGQPILEWYMSLF